MQIELKCPSCPCRFAESPSRSGIHSLERMIEEGPWFALAEGETFEDMVCKSLLLRGRIRCPECGAAVLVREESLGELTDSAWAHSTSQNPKPRFIPRRLPRPR